MVNWQNISSDFNEELQKDWENKGFSYEEVRDWINVGLRVKEADLAGWLRDKAELTPELALNSSNIEELRQEHQQSQRENDELVAWKSIHPDFTSRLQELWEQHEFTAEQTQEWINQGLTPTDYDFANYSKRNNHNPKQKLNLAELRKEHQNNLDWTDISSFFSEYYQKKWQEKGFGYQEAKEWISNGFGAWDSGKAAYYWSGFTPQQAGTLINIGFEVYEHNATNWKNHGFTVQETKQWINIGFEPCDSGEASKWKNHGFTLKQVQEWMSLGFEKNDCDNVVNWKKQNFSFEQIKEWINAGLTPYEYDFAAYLKQNNYIPENAFQKKSKIQTWLDWNYPLTETCKLKEDVDNYEKKENKMTYLDLSHKKLIGSLDLSGFSQLQKLNISDNQITHLDLTGLNDLEILACRASGLPNLDFLISLNEKKLRILNIRDNKLSSDLTPFRNFTNLETLYLDGNNFYGSLEPLKNLSKLKKLDISSTDIDSGLEYLPDSLEEFNCSTTWKETKVKAIEKEWKYFNQDLKKCKEFDGSAQKWLEKNYPENGECCRREDKENCVPPPEGYWAPYHGKRREEITKLDISGIGVEDNKQELKKIQGGLRLKGFTNLKELNCSNNQLTNLDLSNCPNLIKFECNNNALRDLAFLEDLSNLKVLCIKNNPKLLVQDLKVLAFFKDLEILDVSNCPFEGSLKLLEKLDKLHSLNISNTNLKEGLNYLSENCQRFYCNSDYQYKSTKIMKELDKSKCLVEELQDKYYDLKKWRTDKANSNTSSVIPLERLFVIRSNLKQFLNKWGKRTDSDWFEKIVNCYWKTPINDLDKLQEPKEYSKYRYLGGVKWIARATAVTGGILALTDQPVIGGSLAAASPFVDAFATYIEENYYKARETKWNAFLNDADMFLDNYHELLGIIKGIKAGKLGEVNESFKNLREKTNALLDEYDQPDENGEKNGEIDLEELIEKRKDLAEDLPKDKKESKVWEMFNAMKELEKKVTDYRQGVNIEETKASEIINSINKDQPEQVAINVITEEIINQSLHSSQANLLDKSQREEVEMQNLEQQSQILQTNPPSNNN